MAGETGRLISLIATRLKFGRSNFFAAPQNYKLKSHFYRTMLRKARYCHGELG